MVRRDVQVSSTSKTSLDTTTHYDLVNMHVAAPSATVVAVDTFLRQRLERRGTWRTAKFAIIAALILASCGGDDGTSLTGGGPPDDGGDLGIELDTPVEMPVDDAHVTVTIDELSFDAPQELVDQQIVTSAYIPVLLDVTVAVTDDYDDIVFYPDFVLEGSEQIYGQIVEGDLTTEVGETTEGRVLFNVPGEAIAEVDGGQPVTVDSLVLYDDTDEIGRLDV